MARYVVMGPGGDGGNRDSKVLYTTTHNNVPTYVPSKINVNRKFMRKKILYYKKFLTRNA